MPSMPVTRWEIAAKDLKRQAAFYAELFGWEFTYHDGGRYAHVTTGLLDGAFVQADPPASDVLVYVQVPNAQAVVDKMTRLGGSVVCPVTVTPDAGTLAYVQDPEGVCWGLTQE